MANIYYNGKLMETTDGRFNKKQSQFGSDPRINKTKKVFKIKLKTILWAMFWIAIIVLGQFVDRGLITPQKALEAPITKVQAKDGVSTVSTPIVENKLSIKDKILKKFGTDGIKMAAVATCESNMTADRIGDSYPIHGQIIPSVGVFQIRLLKDRPSKEWLLNEDNNISYAAGMYKSQGLTPWLWCGNHYKQFVK